MYGFNNRTTHKKTKSQINQIFVDLDMKIETKSFLLGISAGIIGVLTFILIIGDVETEFSFSTGDKKQDKNIEVSIERIIENGEDLTNVVIKGEGDVTRKELEEELDRMLEKQGIDKEKTKLNIEMEIQS
tara:strand:- start:94 stop:483 length:390 start_codon:yes stop_codon:yes gene_type:complete